MDCTTYQAQFIATRLSPRRLHVELATLLVRYRMIQLRKARNVNIVNILSRHDYATNWRKVSGTTIVRSGTADSSPFSKLADFYLNPLVSLFTFRFFPRISSLSWSTVHFNPSFSSSSDSANRGAAKEPDTKRTRRCLLLLKLKSRI